MQSRRDMIAIACETLNRLFSTNEDRLIKQVNKILDIIIDAKNLIYHYFILLKYFNIFFQYF